jgi:hypothetical protein
VDRVDFEHSRVKPNFSLNTSIGGDIWKRDNASMGLQFDATNLTNRLNLINFAGLFSGNAVAPPRGYSVRLQFAF